MKTKFIMILFIISSLFMFYSCKDEKEFVVTFDNVSGVQKQNVKEGNKVTKPNDPVKQGYTFEGWYNEDKVWNFDTDTVNSDISLTPKFSVIEYSITYNLSGGRFNGKYLTREDMVKDFVSDYNLFTFSRIESPADVMNDDYRISFFESDYISNKWRWMFEALVEAANEQKIYVNFVEYMTLNNPIVTDQAVQSAIFYLLGINETKWNSMFKIVYGDLLDKNYNIDCSDDVVKESWTKYVKIASTYTIEDEVVLENPIYSGYAFLGWFNVNTKHRVIHKGSTGNINLTAEWEDPIKNSLGKFYYENNKTYINIGKYPQSLVTNNDLINELSRIETVNENGYLEYTRTIKDDNQTYTITKEYAKVVAAPYYSNVLFNNGRKINSGETYYFEVAPIKWEVIKNNGNEYQLFCSSLIDISAFYSGQSVRNIYGNDVYQNNYEYSTIRAWLNSYDGRFYDVADYTNKGFFDIAFSEEEKSMINLSTIDNSASSSGYSNSDYSSDYTFDKVYLLSYSDVVNSSFGFDTSTDSSSTRYGYTTDYVRAKGSSLSLDSNVYGNNNWWLRSPANNNPLFIRDVNETGAIIENRIASNNTLGVRPAITITLGEKENNVVVFKDMDSTILSVQQVKTGEAASTPIINEHEGYRFVGWSSEFSNVTNDMIIFAEYEVVEYKAILDLGDGNETTELHFDINNDLLIEEPIKFGFKFVGWYENGELVDTFKCKDYYLVAKWEEYNFDLDIDSNIFVVDGVKYLYFGRYPQTIVDDVQLINILKTIDQVNQNGYIEYDGNEYKKTNVNPYSNDYTYSNLQLVSSELVSFFKVEPIKWRVIESEDHKYKLVSDLIIDNKQFHTSVDERIVDQNRIFANNYKYSDIRAWLNGYDGTSYEVANYSNQGFFDIAFNDDEQYYIMSTIIDNSIASSGDSSNPYLCDDTYDKVALLSYTDVINTHYGYEIISNNTLTRCVQPTDYALSQGSFMHLNTRNSFWWLRTPGSALSNESNFVDNNGKIEYSYSGINKQRGICPSITIYDFDVVDVEFVDYDDSVIKHEKLEVGNSATAPADPTRDGYKFLGWSQSFDDVTENLVVKALYEIIEYNLTYNLNGGVTEETFVNTFNYESETIELPILTKEHFEFVGWFNKDNVKFENIEKGSFGDLELTAVFEGVIYIITLHVGEEQELLKYTYDTETFELPTPVNPGYTFKGWFDVDDNQHTTVEKGSFGNFDLTSKWEMETYTITFVDQTELEPIEYTIESEPIELPTLTKEHYEFLGWFTEEGEKVEKIEKGSYGNKELHALWEAEVYVISYDTDGGMLGEDTPLVYTIETETFNLVDPIKKGYIFKGWFNSQDVEVETIEKGSTGDITLTAKWEKEFTIEFYKENGQLYSNVGSYPQSIVTDTNIINELNNITEVNNKGYIEYEEVEYVKVTSNPFGSGYKFNNNDVILSGQTYYFKVEPIKWKVIQIDNSKYTLLSDIIIDNIQFNNDDETRKFNDTTIYSNNYMYSNIRAWLNGYNGSTYDVENYEDKGFLNAAFTEQELKFLTQTLVDNSLESTGYTQNEYLCENTEDIVYLLSGKDVVNPLFGFNTDEARKAVVSDYARSKGSQISIESDNYGYGNWLLRTPNIYSSKHVNFVDYNGNSEISSNVSNSNYGVRPVITIIYEE